MNALLSGSDAAARQLRRHLREGRISHAYLFYGPQGTEKAEMALEFAQALFCAGQAGQSCLACGACDNCRRIEHGNHPDCHLLSPQGNSFRIEQIRQLQRDVARKGTEAARKVYILQEADKLTPQAANSLLKFLEEPVSPVVVILLAQQQEQLLPTIRSRCCAISFAPPPPDRLFEALIEEGFAPHCARIAASLRSGLAEARSICQFEEFDALEKLMLQWSEEVARDPGQALLTLHTSVMRKEQEVPLFLDLFLLWLRELLNVHLQRQGAFLFEHVAQERQKQAALWPVDKLTAAMEGVFQLHVRSKSPVQLQLALEGMLIGLSESAR